jgi:ankyrin repeat protein
MAELLIANGADINAQRNDRWTPLHQAANMELAESAELLIASGANINAKSYYLQTRERRGAQTPIEVAIESGDTKIVDLLRKHGGKTSEQLKAEAK